MCLVVQDPSGIPLEILLFSLENLSMDTLFGIGVQLQNIDGDHAPFSRAALFGQCVFAHACVCACVCVLARVTSSI